MSGFIGQRFWPGRYIVTTGYWHWTGRMSHGEPDVTVDVERALVFVSARHAYESARPVPSLQSWRVRRLANLQASCARESA